MYARGLVLLLIAAFATVGEAVRPRWKKNPHFPPPIPRHRSIKSYSTKEHYKREANGHILIYKTTYSPRHTSTAAESLATAEILPRDISSSSSTSTPTLGYDELQRPVLNTRGHARSHIFTEPARDVVYAIPGTTITGAPPTPTAHRLTTLETQIASKRQLVPYLEGLPGQIMEPHLAPWPSKTVEKRDNNEVIEVGPLEPSPGFTADQGCRNELCCGYLDFDDC